MENKEINDLLKRKHFLLRGLNNNNVENRAEAKRQVLELDDQIRDKTKVILHEQQENLKVEVRNIKATVFTDGDMKRAIANSIIKILENCLDPSDLKGVFRQGYKLMRHKC